MPMKIWSKFLAGLLPAVFALPAVSVADCDKSAPRTARLDATGATKIVITAGAGELKVSGERGRNQLEANGKACASSQKVLDQIRLDSRRDGETLIITTVFPEGAFIGPAQLDLTVVVPDNIAVSIEDSSGAVDLQNVRSAVLTDSSGDVEVSNIGGDLTITDSSGALAIKRVGGNLSVNDSSGDLEIEQVSGQVLIPVDSSGAIRIERAGSVHIMTDSSGDISIRQVQGDVLIDNDSSGDIAVTDIGGKFTVLNDGSGSIRQQQVAGAVSVPQR